MLEGLSEDERHCSKHMVSSYSAVPSSGTDIRLAVELWIHPGRADSQGVQDKYLKLKKNSLGAGRLEVRKSRCISAEAARLCARSSMDKQVCQYVDLYVSAASTWTLAAPGAVWTTCSTPTVSASEPGQVQGTV